MHCVVYTMCPNDEVAHEIVVTLLNDKLIACANIVNGVKSRYWWKDKIEENDEVLVIMKTQSQLFNDVKECIMRLHPYEVPEIISTKIEDGLIAYLDWIGNVTT